MVENWHKFIKESVNFGWEVCISLNSLNTLNENYMVHLYSVK